MPRFKTRRTPIELRPPVLDHLRRSESLILFVLVLLMAGLNMGCAASDQPLLQIASGRVPVGTAQSAYRANLIASGGIPPYAWKIQSGQLPPGLSFDPQTGTVSGTPQKSGNWTIMFAVADHFRPQPATARASFTFEIADSAAQLLTVVVPALPSGQVSQPYQASTTATGGTQPYTWGISSGNLPPGLDLAAGGRISGTPSASGNFQFGLRVTDSSSPPQSATQSNAITVSNTQFDAYGGLVTMPSLNAPTGVFRAEKFGNKWMLVDPDNNALFMIGMYVLNGSSSVDDMGSSYFARVTAKYGDDGPHWATAQLQRIQAWGYNTIGPYASGYALPVTRANTWDTPDHTNPVKFPFVGEIRPSLYAMQNLNNWGPQPVKNMMFGLSKFYTGYRPGIGVADLYDNNLSIFLANELAQDPSMTTIKTSPYKQYLIGMTTDDSDEMYGFGNGPDFKTGHSNAHLGWMVLTMSPMQIANSLKGFVYSDATVYSKKALRDQLAAQYGSINALNSAWGSNYTSFDSSGSSITEAIATGDGSTRSFSHSLGETTVTAFSLEILENGQVVGGDQGDGTVWGPALSGSINYDTGALNLSFSSGNAPAATTALTAVYVKDGWGIGSGLMDEDGRPAHQTWTGIDFTYLRDANPSLKSDLDEFLFQIADHYFSMGKSQIQAWMPGVMYLGPNSLGSWGAPSNREILKAAAKDIDVMVMGGSPTGPLTQPMLDFIFTYYGDKPLYIGEFRLANPDSAFFSYPIQLTFATQQARGQDYFDGVTKYPTAAYSANGSRPYVGVFWWQYVDNVGQKSNWGLVSPSDNAYDGREAVIGPGGPGVRSIPCAAPLQTLSCGGEQRNYGDVISALKSAHQKIMEAVQH
jgi:hypothetical protein